MPTTAKTLGITVTSGVKGQPIYLYNRTTGESIRGTLGDTAKAVFDLTNFTSDISADDVIEIIVSGERIGSTTLTATGSAQSVTVSTSAITSGLTRGIR